MSEPRAPQHNTNLLHEALKAKGWTIPQAAAEVNAPVSDVVDLIAACNPTDGLMKRLMDLPNRQEVSNG